MKFIILILVGLTVCHASTQRYSVKGKLICPSNPAAAKNAVIKLYDEDFGPDDVIVELKGTESDGSFDISGTATDIGKMETRMKIYHNCMDSTPGFRRELKFSLPKEYIDGDVFDFGIFNLEIGIDDEESTENFASDLLG